MHAYIYMNSYSLPRSQEAEKTVPTCSCPKRFSSSEALTEEKAPWNLSLFRMPHIKNSPKSERSLCRGTNMGWGKQKGTGSCQGDLSAQGLQS